MAEGNRRWVVGAFEDDVLAYLASIAYDSKESADKYCEKCTAECAAATHKTYKVIEMDEDEDDILD